MPSDTHLWVNTALSCSHSILPLLMVCGRLDNQELTEHALINSLACLLNCVRSGSIRVMLSINAQVKQQMNIFNIFFWVKTLVALILIDRLLLAFIFINVQEYLPSNELPHVQCTIPSCPGDFILPQ